MTNLWITLWDDAKRQGGMCNLRNSGAIGKRSVNFRYHLDFMA
jgi:hypothetical protein